MAVTASKEGLSPLSSDNPRYILDLVSRVIQMSVETQKIVASLPKLEF